MTSCFWKLCDCPDRTPTGQACTQHTGINCSILNGTAIPNVNQINDAMTASLEVEIATLDRDKQSVETKVRELEARKTDLERKQADLKRNMNAADSAGSRRRVIVQAKNDIATFTAEKTRLKAELEDLERIIDNPRRAIRLVRNRLQIPYRNAAGICACNNRKAQMLDTLASNIHTWEIEQAQLVSRLRVLIQYSQMQWVLAIPPTIGLFATLVAIIFFGYGFIALILPVLLFMLSVMLILTSQIRIYYTTLDLINADRILAVLILEHYRIQQIPVCQRPIEEPQDEDPWDWWEDWFGQLITPHVPEENQGFVEPAFPPDHEIPPSD